MILYSWTVGGLLGPGRGLSCDMAFCGINRFPQIKILEVIWSSYPLLTEEELKPRGEVTCLCNFPSTESGPQIRSSLGMLGPVVLCVPPWNMSKTVAAGFLWKIKEENLHLLRWKQVVLALSVGGLLWNECGWLFWGCFLEERKEF